MAKHWIAILILVSQGAAPAHALGLLDAYRAALRLDAGVRAGDASVLIAQERIHQARASLLPTVGLTVSVAKNNIQRSTDADGGAVSRIDERYDSQNQSIQVRQPLYRRAAWLMHDQVVALHGDAQAQRDQDLASVAQRIVATYTEALLAREEMTLAASERRFMQEQLDAAVRAQSAGRGTRTDVDDIRARLDLHAAHELDVTQRWRLAIHELALRTGEQILALPMLSVAKMEELGLGERPLSDWLVSAEGGNPAVRAAQAKLAASRLEVAGARAMHEPVLDAFAQVVRSRSETVTTPSSRYLNRTVGLQLSVPLYAGGSTGSVVRQALAAQDRAEALLEQARVELSLAVTRAFHAWHQTHEKMRALSQVEASARLAMQSTERSREAGVRTLADVLDAERRLQAVRRDLAQTRYAHLQSRIALVALAGEDLWSEVTRQNDLLQVSD